MTRNEKLKQLSLPYEDKLKRTRELILEWYLQYKGDVYVSFSGGKDSTVLLSIARGIKGLDGIRAVFIDTGLEYPEVRNFAMSKPGVIVVKPKITFKQVLDKYGWPIVSKEVAQYLSDIKNSKSDKLRTRRLNGDEKHRFRLPEKWRPLIKTDFKISNKCCTVMKKSPAKQVEKEYGKPILAVMAEESSLRRQKYLGTNCNAFSAKRPESNPMAFWNEQDVLRYIYENNLPIASIYGDVIIDKGKYITTGCKRTGCMFCMFGLHLEKYPNRFDRMKETHPKQYDYIMNKLGGAEIMSTYLECARKKKGQTK